MSYPFFHLALNHFPVIGISVVTILLGVALFYNNNFVAKVALWLSVLFALMTISVYWTGKNSVAYVSSFSNVSPAFIASHMEMANKASISMGILGGLALLGIVLFWGKKEVPKYFSAIVLIMTLVGTVFFAKTDEIGSLIAHPELRANEAQALTAPQVQAFNSEDSQSQGIISSSPTLELQSGGKQ
ncbi:hypothetical protein I8751_28125 [Nostocaceae cyanobacterium CENA357]|uniref:Uncharacterized protein n=1 Tax=Atlanticothrix silvestris CENA357 TaxID=1725252 RepID=A0A8J7L5R6_9CYAN|nr:hypothetical protein [Atlanticothrix silvestris]MBH8556136.1 hypothetical protein [Atlanticothrix silvestris CENA357]